MESREPWRPPKLQEAPPWGDRGFGVSFFFKGVGFRVSFSFKGVGLRVSFSFKGFGFRVSFLRASGLGFLFKGFGYFLLRVQGLVLFKGLRLFFVKGSGFLSFFNGLRLFFVKGSGFLWN